MARQKNPYCPLKKIWGSCKKCEKDDCKMKLRGISFQQFERMLFKGTLPNPKMFYPNHQKEVVLEDEENVD